jgi:hypothetical protein
MKILLCKPAEAGKVGHYRMHRNIERYDLAGQYLF